MVSLGGEVYRPVRTPSQADTLRGDEAEATSILPEATKRAGDHSDTIPGSLPNRHHPKAGVNGPGDAIRKTGVSVGSFLTGRVMIHHAA